jgi:hypothetical protein
MGLSQVCMVDTLDLSYQKVVVLIGNVYTNLVPIKT